MPTAKTACIASEVSVTLLFSSVYQLQPPSSLFCAAIRFAAVSLMIEFRSPAADSAMSANMSSSNLVSHPNCS